MRIALDFDGTICEDNYPKIGKPKLETIRWVKRQIKLGHQEFLNTVRAECADLIVPAVVFCNHYGIKLSGVLFHKCHVDVFLDDKNMKLGDMKKIKNIKEFKRGK